MKKSKKIDVEDNFVIDLIKLIEKYEDLFLKQNKDLTFLIYMLINQAKRISCFMYENKFTCIGMLTDMLMYGFDKKHNEIQKFLEEQNEHDS